ncbi:DUF2283 domain-containing protein [Nodosilinea sp. LEGE 07088]|uniref:DUF2283 domain-containing protein n=1 Tax=Nodosilinea sp. LEGE 07088 TaxID=2777968 RepID=UPI00188140EF|nr:DUF2283 domain-containing protein [Nodosilinea sp. LEGE 07088]MBE9137862.1 DUF2283 domain-containing protein [Nodosilinea sp. LEGE 07088]
MAAIDILQSVPYLLQLPSKRTWIDYDDEADVLYISFQKPQQANDSVLEDSVIYHYRDDDLVGITVLQALQRSEANASVTSSIQGELD